MLLRVQTAARLAHRVESRRLGDFGISEREFQAILFDNLERLLPDEELLLLSQSRIWQEEPDLLALDEKGRLFIFELKIWEARSENILQALRYGQIFGQYSYDDLNNLYLSHHEQSARSLAEAHMSTFGDVGIEQFNSGQVFVVVTNGLDFKTREAAKYWRSRGLDVRPWVYRTYSDSDSADGFLLEMSRFATVDDPYEDVATNYYILNTNYSNDPTDHEEMLKHQKAAAYFVPWKHKIERLSRGDQVFLYQSGRGIVACGYASGRLEKAPYQGNPEWADEEYSMALTRFQLVDPPLSASDMKTISERNFFFNKTMYPIDEDSAVAFREAIGQR